MIFFLETVFNLPDKLFLIFLHELPVFAVVERHCLKSFYFHILLFLLFVIFLLFLRFVLCEDFSPRQSSVAVLFRTASCLAVARNRIVCPLRKLRKR
jgi:hypothetical protein